MDKFFLRYYLQRMQGVLGENFPYECIMDASKEEISSFIEECDTWQQEQARIICKSLDTSPLHGKKVLFVGDSLTADRLGYRGIVTKAACLNAHNAAISGAISPDMLRYLPDRISAFKPEIISVMIGTNDSLIVAGEKNLVSLEEYEQNIEKIVVLAKASQAQVVLSTIPPTDEKRFGSYERSNNNVNIGKYCDIVRAVSCRCGAVLNDFANEIMDEPLENIIENDGVHLTRYGQARFAQKWMNTLLESRL